MKKSILVTGVTGTGKSTTCTALKNLGYSAVDIESIDDLYELVDEATGRVVPGGPRKIAEGLDWNCNKARLASLIDDQDQDVTFYCGGMANTSEVWDLFDSVIVLTVSDATSLDRLATRKSGEFGNTSASREWVLSWKHDIENEWSRLGGVFVSAEAEPTDVAKSVVQALGH